MVNWGMSISGWLGLARISIVVIILTWTLFHLGKTAILLYADADMTSRVKRGLKISAVSMVVSIIAAFALLVNFGPGSYQGTDVEDEGHHSMVEETYPEEMSQPELDENAYDAREEVLKAQDRGPEEEREEANKYMERALQRAKRNEQLTEGEVQ